MLFFLYMVESAMAGFTGLALIGIRIKLKQVLIVGALQGLVIYFVRGTYTMFNIPFGTHILFNLMGLIIILRFVTGHKWGVVTIGAAMAFIVTLMSESLLIPPVYEYLQLSLDQVLTDAKMHILMGYICDWLLIVTTIVMAITKKSLIDLGSRESW